MAVIFCIPTLKDDLKRTPQSVGLIFKTVKLNFCDISSREGYESIGQMPFPISHCKFPKYGLLRKLRLYVKSILKVFLISWTSFKIMMPCLK
jgi:hypothetical protein